MDFLLAWSVFESECFGKSLSLKKIEKMSIPPNYDGKFNKELDSLFHHFHQRYQDSKLRSNLVHKDKCNWFDSLLNDAINNISSCDKLKFPIYVTYRFRNNMFHGNKGLKSWMNYQTEIEYCTQIMIQIHGLLSESFPEANSN